MQCINIYPPPKYNTVVSLKLVEYQIFMDYVVEFTGISEIDGYVY